MFGRAISLPIGHFDECLHLVVGGSPRQSAVGASILTGGLVTNFEAMNLAHSTGA